MACTLCKKYIHLIIHCFQSITGPVGFIDEQELILSQLPVHRETYTLKSPLPKIDIIKSYLDADDKNIRYAIEHGVDGIILEGVGRGQVSPFMVDAVKEGIAKGIPFVVTTSAQSGQVYPTYQDSGGA